MKNLLVAAFLIAALSKTFGPVGCVTSGALVIVIAVLFWILPVKVHQSRPINFEKIIASLSVLLWFQVSWTKYYPMNGITEALAAVTVLMFLVATFREDNLSFLLLFISGTLVVGLPIITMQEIPYCDMFLVQKGGCYAALQGLNPYQGFYGESVRAGLPNLDYYPYLPGMLYYYMPFEFIFGDPRYGNIFALLAISAMAYRYNRWLGVCVFFVPRYIYWLELCQTDVVLALLVYIYAIGRKYRPVSLGFLLATKQYALFLVPALRPKSRTLMGSLGIATVLVAPFLIWDHGEFIRDTVLWHFSYKTPHWNYNLPSILRAFNINTSWNLLPVGLLATGALLWKREFGYDLSGIALLVFFFFSSQLQPGYVYLAVWLLYLHEAMKYKTVASLQNHMAQNPECWKK